MYSYCLLELRLILFSVLFKHLLQMMLTLFEYLIFVFVNSVMSIKTYSTEFTQKVLEPLNSILPGPKENTQYCNMLLVK